ncbi:DNA alkylation repair protein [Tahibacter sp.]|uniref:DNA alkylation repair protein n=1 Tax=Tahibacter sp. TaxID=2056211 RepID=UPI0028C3A667|nr:DNA alkylation repair protein [Tahibacter sp.]
MKASAKKAPAKIASDDTSAMRRSAVKPGAPRSAASAAGTAAAKKISTRTATTTAPRAKATTRDDTAIGIDARCAQAVAALKAHASEATRAGMARYAIPNDKAFGVSMRDVQAVAKRYRYDHALAESLWQTDLYDARMLACYIDDPALVDAAQMERWIGSVDNWAHCDTPCFVLFDRTPHAWKKVDAWATRSEEFVRRGAFALLASLTVHDKQAGDEPFLRGLLHIEAAAGDERNFVRKAVNWALRSIGKRNVALHAAAVAVAQRLAAQKEATPRWIGKDALRELNSAAVVARLAARKPKTRKG